jgi:hypothetical protein
MPSKRLIVGLAACLIATTSPARAEPVSATIGVVLAGKALLAKLGLIKVAGATAGAGMLAAPAKVIAVSAASKTVLSSQAALIATKSGTATLTSNTITVTRHVATGSASTMTLSRAGITGALTGAGLLATSGSAAADDELASELAIARANDAGTWQLAVCRRPDGNTYGVPSSWERCPRAGEELMTLSLPLDIKGLR